MTADPAPACPLPLEVLVYQALDRWDDIVLLLQYSDDDAAGLTFRSANRPFCRATGYAEAELHGRGFDLLRGPGTDPGPFAALADAASDGRSARLELPCTDKAGRNFWFGMHLLPVPGLPALFVILGRDITEAIQARQRQAAIQGLLAKVFLNVDAGVAIADSDGVLLMTNPCADRLFGGKPHQLTGRNALELVAPEARTMAAVARERQMQDGRDVTITVPLLRLDGSRLSAHLHVALIETPDRRRFSVLTARPSTALPATPPPPCVLASRIGLTGIVAAKPRLGSRWAATAQRAMAVAEQVIRRTLEPHATVARSGECAFILCFSAMAEPAAAAYAVSIARDIRHHLIGSGETPATAHVTAVTAMLPVTDGADANATRLGAVLEQAFADRLESIQAAARVTLRTALAQPRSTLEPLYGRTADTGCGAFLGLPQAAEQQIRTALATLPPEEVQETDLDAVWLDLATDQPAGDRVPPPPLLVEVDFAIFDSRARLDRYVAACRLLDPRLRQRLVLVLTDMPPSTPRGRLLECIMRLRPFCRVVGLALDRPEAAPADLSLSGASLIVVDAAALGRLPAAELGNLLSRLQLGRAQLLVRRTRTWEEAATLLAGGVDLVSVSPA